MKFFSDYNSKGGIKELLALALPMIISSACDGVMTFTDRLFLAKVGTEQMNAAMGGGIAIQVIMFFFMGLAGYSTALVAQYFGAKEKTAASMAAFQAILISLAAWPIIMMLNPLITGYFHLMNLPGSQIGYQIEYTNILAWGSVFGLLRYTLGCYYTGIGKTKIVMIATTTAMLVNVVLDYIFIFGKLGFPQMGVRGAAIATITGAAFGMLVLIFAYTGRKNRTEFSVMKSIRFDKVIMKKLLYFGYPAGLEMFFNFLAFSVMISIFHSQGDVVATATTVLFNWDLVSFIPLVGIEIAVTSLVGRYMGAKAPEIAYRSAISGMKTGLFYSVIILFLFIFATETLVRVFTPDSFSPVFEQSVPLTISMIRIAAFYVLFEAMLNATVGALRGAGDTHFTMLISSGGHWVIIPILYLSLNVFKFSVVVSWILLVVFFLALCCTMAIRFKRGKWRQIKVI